jgi:hypothetical protein
LRRPSLRRSSERLQRRLPRYLRHRLAALPGRKSIRLAFRKPLLPLLANI